MTTKAVTKTNRNNEPVATKRTKMKSNVEDFKDIEWNRESKNPIVDNAIEHDDFTFTIEFQDQQYDTRSPNYKLMRQIRKYRTKMGNGKLTDDQKMNLYEEYEDSIEAFIEDVIIDFKFEDIERISVQDTEWLSGFCWEFYVYGKKKLTEQASDSIK